jgi:hypothetical protein
MFVILPAEAAAERKHWSQEPTGQLQTCQDWDMARGWESKSVESQIESAESRRHGPPHVELTQEEIARQRERESLELSRTRVLHDIAATTNPRYRQLLEAGLRHLEAKLNALQRSSES